MALNPKIEFYYENLDMYLAVAKHNRSLKKNFFSYYISSTISNRLYK